MFLKSFPWRVVLIVTMPLLLFSLLIGVPVSKVEAGGVVTAAQFTSGTVRASEYGTLAERQALLPSLVLILLLIVLAMGLLLYQHRARVFSRREIADAEKKSQEALELYRCLQSEYDAVLDTVSDLVLFLNPEQKITWINLQAESVLGTEYATIIGRSCHEIWHTLIGDGFLCPARKCLLSGTPERSIGWTREKKQFEIRAVPVKDSCGTIVRIIEIGRDITAQRCLEQQLRQLQKIESIGWLTTGIVHDFNNILTGIIGFAYLLQKKDTVDDQSRNYLANISTAAERAEILTRTFLAFTRSQSVSIVAEDLNEIVRGAEGLLDSLLGEDIELRLRLSASEIPVLADSRLLGQVLLNIAVHCRAALRAGNSFVVSTSTWLLPVENSAGVDDLSGDFACLQIEIPTGIVPTRGWEVLEQVFPLVGSCGEGEDLGLAVARGIVEQHGGSITLTNGAGSGTVFSIFLPLQREAGLKFWKADTASALSGGNETILIVEDDQWARSFLRELFEGAGYGIVEAGDSASAMEKFRLHGAAISLVLSDLVIPHMNGRDLCLELANIRPDVKVLYMSGYPVDVIRERGIRVDDCTVLPKPFNPVELLHAVRSVLQSTR
ncbi:MAG: PAS domain-containing sensor histidine kinase [Deltaproteobacteria bacterium]|nr:PAS domain-containing sensor histidine kinase [Deltaproteobacteria bacterium]TLN01759.1 MAG: response regulator [bacterium]